MTMSRPATTRSTVSCYSLIRWLDTSAALPGQRPQQAAHPQDDLRIHAVERLTHYQHRRVAHHRRGDPHPLPRAQRCQAHQGTAATVVVTHLWDER